MIAPIITPNKLSNTLLRPAAAPSDLSCQPKSAVGLLNDLEINLQTFVSWALEQSYAKQYPQEIRLQLLDCAWEEQKLLWAIRNHDCCSSNN